MRLSFNKDYQNGKAKIMNETTSSGFFGYEQGCKDAWLYKLQVAFRGFNDKVGRHTGTYLIEPIFHINPNCNREWGSWNPSTRVMMISAKLLRNFEWAAVEHVLRHEIAHQIVSEIFKMDCYGVAHGEAFKRACLIVDVDSSRCASHELLDGFKGSGDNSPMVEKVRKIIIKANDRTISEEEANLFMMKAQELMLRYDIDMKDVMGSEKVWVKRPFGPLFNRWPSYMWTLGNLLANHFSVKFIRTYGPVLKGYTHTHRLELFGEPAKLDIAEYVGHALLNQAELLYEEYKNDIGRSRYDRRRISKASFIIGVLNGYADKLYKNRSEVEKHIKEQIEEEQKDTLKGCSAIIPVYDKGLMDEMFGKSYGRINKCHGGSIRGSGYGEGRAAGSKLTLSQGLYSQGNRGGMLMA